jgi:DNA adenine methylase
MAVKAATKCLPARSAPLRPLWGSPGGKKLLASRIVAMIPAHRTYVEPFAGGAAVFWAKPPTGREVLADRDPEIAAAYRFVRDLSAAELSLLRRRDWNVTEARFNRLLKSKPGTPVDRFYRFAHLVAGSYGSQRLHVSPSDVGTAIGMPSRLEAAHVRLAGVQVHQGNALATIQRYDGPGTFFYLDPPFPSSDQQFGTAKFTPADLERLCKGPVGIRGKFLMSLAIADRKHLPSGPRWQVREVRPRRLGSPEQARAREILVANYRLPS